MNKLFLFLFMIFLHIIADYNLQGILASMKQKSWWTNQNEYTKLYRYDYIISLIMHSISWTFMIMLPSAIYLKFAINAWFIALFAINTILHSYIDNLKANQKMINLCVDQLLHMVQIICTFIIITNI